MSRVLQLRHNLGVVEALFQHGTPASTVAIVCGTAHAQRFWERHLEIARPSLRARRVVSLHEDLPVNQAFGLLLTWKRLRPQLQPKEGALVAFVFGEGTRITPFTEAEAGQKPAITSWASVKRSGGRHWFATVEHALRLFAPVEAYLRRSGFDGLVVKWGDEVQLPTLDLAGADPRLAGADVVRFVSMARMTEDLAAAKDWVGVDEQGRITAFIPRRPLARMAPLADRGLLQRRDGHLVGGVNLGSIAVSRRLLDGLLAEFERDVEQPGADRRTRPDLDPQFFTALTIAAIANPVERKRAWAQALGESAAMRAVQHHQPELLRRLRKVLRRYEERYDRPIRMVALDFGRQYWSDVGQHRQLYRSVMALREHSEVGSVSRAVAGIDGRWDDRGNLIVGGSVLGPQVDVRDSVLVDVRIGAGVIRDSVLVGTRAGFLHAMGAFDLHSTVSSLKLPERAGAYKVIRAAGVEAQPGERLTTVFLDSGPPLLFRVHEDTDLRRRDQTYDVPILGNPMSFREAHQRAVGVDPNEMEGRRSRARRSVI